jgi:ketosteroid isomerase-like protein
VTNTEDGAVRGRIVIAGLAVIALWFAWQWFFPNDEAQIRAALERIAENVGSAASEGDVGRIARAAALRNELDPHIVVDAGPPFSRMTGRDTVIGTAARLNMTLRDLEIRFSDVEVTVDPDRNAATVVTTAEARYSDGQNQPGLEARELELVCRRLDGRWVISEVALVRTLTPVTPR